MGSGGGMSMEDAVVLSSLLGHSKTVEQAVIALRVYDESRRPRGERLVDASRETGKLHTGRLGGVDFVKEAMAAAEKDRFKWILDFDIQGQRDETISELLARLAV
jgi:salicylate hydroxylase